MKNNYGAGFVWDRSVKRWRGPDGTFAKPTEILAAVQQLIAGASEEMDGATLALHAGQITQATWQDRLTELTKLTHLAAALSAGGGTAGWSDAAQTALDVQLSRQWGYMDGFFSEIAAGQQPMNGTLGARARLYLKAASGTFWEVLRAVQPAKRERRRLHPTAAHCADCVAQAGLQWQLPGILKPIGTCACGSNCACYYEIETFGHLDI